MVECVNLVLESVSIVIVRDNLCHRNKVIFKGRVVDYSEIFFSDLTEDLILDNF